MIYERVKPVKVRILESLEDPDLESGWKRLYLEGGLFLHSSLEWARLWWKHFGHSNRKLHLLVGESNGVIQSIAPFMVESSSFFRQLKFIGSGLTDYHEVLFDQKAGIAQVKSLLRAILDSREYDLVNLEQISDRSPVYSCLMKNGRLQSRKMSQCLSMRLDFPTWEDYEKRLSKNTRKNCRSKQRRLERNGQMEFRCHYSSDITPELKSAVFRLVEENYRRTGRFDKLTMQPMQTFISEMTQIIPETTIFTFKLEGVLMAYSLGFFQNNIYYSWNTAFNHEFSRYSPGVLLRYHLIRFLIEKEARGIDLMRGDYDYKRSFLVDEDTKSANYQFLQKTMRFRGTFGLQYYLKWKWTAKNILGQTLRVPRVHRWLLGRKHRNIGSLD